MLQENDRSERLARLIRYLRGDASTYTFGAQLDVTHSTIRRWESGQGGINEVGVEKLSQGTGIPTDMIRAYLRGSIQLETCLGLEEQAQSQVEQLVMSLSTLPIQELHTILDATLTQLLKRYPKARPEVVQILHAATQLLGISATIKDSQ